jgi:precorrin-2 dehydrogenase/sirohydrochlorin ferrochelatase
MIPLLHDFEGETVLAFGGGRVGARKARRFAREADVVVVSPAFVDESFGDAKRIRAAPGPGAVAGWVERTDPALVVAATDDEAVNGAAETAARERGILHNRADRHDERGPGSVVVPATVRDDPVVVAVGTGGTSPALSRYLREGVESEFAGAGAMADLTGELREELQDRGLPVEKRRAAVRAVVRSPEVWKALDSGSAKPRSVALDVIEDVTGDLS